MIRITKDLRKKDTVNKKKEKEGLNECEEKEYSKKGINALKEAFMRAIVTYKEYVIMDGELYRTNSENMIRDILNISLKLNLVNANTVKKNYETIDLIDEDNKIVVQVSTAGNKEQQKKKIKKTLEGFQENTWLQENETLLIVFILNLESQFEYQKLKPDQTINHLIDLESKKEISVKFTDLNHLYSTIILTNTPKDIEKIVETLEGYIGRFNDPNNHTSKIYSSNEKGSEIGTMDLFCKFLGYDDDDDFKKTLLHDVIMFKNQLSSLSTTSRQVIVEIILRRDRKKNSYVRFNYQYLKSKSPRQSLLDTNLEILTSLKFIDSEPEYDDGSEYYRLSCPNIDDDIFFPIINFLDNESKIKKLIEELDFSILN